MGKDYVFTGPEGGLLNLTYLREKIWYSTLAEAKVRRRTFYQMHHTFAAGENPKWLADTLEHKSTEILFDAYEKFIPRRTRMDGGALLSRMREESGCTPNPNELVTPQTSGIEGG